MTEQSSDEIAWYPDLYPADRAHLQRQYNRYGRERVIGWLKAKLTVPLRYKLDDDFDEEEYWEGAVEHYVDTATEQGGESP